MVEPVETTGTDMIDVARAALVEITPEANIGAFVSLETTPDGVSTILFASAILGYPDWNWTVSVAQLPDESPTVLEAELLPGDGSVLAPDWIPWADRLEDYKAAQAAIAAGELSESDDSDDDSDDDDADDDDAEDEGDSDDVHGDDDLDDLDLDDLGDDPDDGIDFESDEAPAGEGLAVTPAVDVDEQDEADAESDEDGPEPPAAVRRQQRRQKKQ